MIIDGRKEACTIEGKIRDRVSETGLQPGLVIMMAGDNDASALYVHAKMKRAAGIGIEAKTVNFPERVSTEELVDYIHKCNADAAVSGIIVQMPLPPQVDRDEIILAIAPEKDVDGFHPLNFGRMAMGLPGFYPCTAAGLVRLIKTVEPDISGRNAVVIGRSLIVGKPAAMMLLNENASVSILHSRTRDLAAYTREADIIVACTGKAGIVTPDMVRDGAMVIDVGVTRRADGRVVGDADFDGLKDKVWAITPPIGGVGPMTIAMLLYNTFKACCMKNGMDLEEF